MTPNGQFVSFFSAGGNLVPGDTNGVEDAFLRDRNAGTTERVSVSSAGVEGNAFSIAFDISDDGRYVAFGSMASNLVPGDTNATTDAFLRDRETDTTERVSVTAQGAQASGSISNMTPDARILVISSLSNALVPSDTNNFEDVFVSTFQTTGGNRAPNADAGPDQTVETQGQTANVTLDGSESSDPDGDDLVYLWNENGDQIATGKSPTVALGVGAHEITLEVKDTSGVKDTDIVVITVNAGPPPGDFPLEVAALDSKRIQLKWKDPSTKEKSFQVERSEDDGRTWVRKKTLKAVAGRGRTVSWTDKNVVANTEGTRGAGVSVGERLYRYRVRMLVGRLEPVVSQSRIAYVISAPANLRVDWPAITSTSVPLVWQEPQRRREWL